jgi:hypothetical protein
MSGGSKKKASTPAADTATATPMQTVQPGMPGQINTLADQLAAGFGQQSGDVLSQLLQYYQPMSLPNYAPVAPATPAPARRSLRRQHSNQKPVASPIVRRFGPFKRHVPAWGVKRIMGIFDSIFGQQAQVPGSTQQPNALQQLLSPEVAMPMAAALLGNQGNAANFGNALSAYGTAKAQTTQKNKTMDFFRQHAPDYAAEVDAGMPLDEAWKSYTQQRYAQKQGLVSTPAAAISMIQTPASGYRRPAGARNPKLVCSGVAT